MLALNTSLDDKVLVLNRVYTAIRVISARRAFVMLFKQIAEVISIENGYYVNYDFESWADVAALQRQFEPDAHSWVRTSRFEIAVPKIIRLFGYDRLPRQEVKLNRRNLYARDGNRCQYCGKTFSTRELTLDHVVPPSVVRSSSPPPASTRSGSAGETATVGVMKSVRRSENPCRTLTRQG